MCICSNCNEKINYELICKECESKQYQPVKLHKSNEMNNSRENYLPSYLINIILKIRKLMNSRYGLVIKLIGFTLLILFLEFVFLVFYISILGND